MDEAMKMVMIAYNEALDNEVMEVLNDAGSPNYTKVHGVFGKGTTSGTHLGNDVWPGRNRLLFVAATAEQAGRILAGVRKLRLTLGHEGVKAFVLPVEEFT